MGRKVGLRFVPNFSIEENTYYSLLRQGHKLLDKTYKEYRLQLMDTLKQSDDYFYIYKDSFVYSDERVL